MKYTLENTFVRSFLACAIFTMIFLLPGCSLGSKREALVVWNSPKASPDERVDAVFKLIQVGTTGKEVKKILGPQGVWTHWYGPSANLAIKNGTTAVLPTEDHDFWTLEYAISGGSVALFFEEMPGKLNDDFQFVRVTLRKSLKPE